MKKLIYLIAFLPLFAKAQLHPIKKFIPMEYWVGAIGSDSKIYAWGSLIQNSGTFPLPGGRTIVDAGALFNAFTAVANDGTFWYCATYNNLSTPGMTSWTQVPTDTTGATISTAAGNGAIACWGFQNQYFILRADSSVWTGNVDYFNIFTTSGATIRPIKMTPSGVKIRYLRSAGNGGGGKINVVGISSDSLTVYNWAAGTGASPTTLTTTIGTHKFISANGDGGSQFSYAAIYLVQMTANSTYGHPCVLGNNCILYGGSSGCSTNYTTLTDIYGTLGFTALIKEIDMNEFGAFLIDSARNMWNIGGYNVMGQIGINNELVNKYTYNGYPGYGWDFGLPEGNVYGKQQIGAGMQWSHINNDGFFIFYNYAQDINDSLWSWGRGKDNILAQGYQMQPNDYENHPSCCDILVPTQQHNMWNNVPTYAWTPPTWSAGSNQNITASNTTLTASGAPPKIIRTASPFDTVQYHLNSTLWTQVSGPGTATISAPSSISTGVSGLITGTYVFQNLETDNNTGTNAATVTVIVNVSAGPPTVTCSASPNSITLPTTTTNLSGTVTYNGGATGVSTTWTCTVKPGGAATPTITPGGTLTAPTAAVSGLTTAGTYTFQLSATDSNSNTGSNTVNVTVIASQPNCSCITTPF